MNTMQSLEFEWQKGDVGDYWLRLGLNQRTAHVYQTPWTGQKWWVDAERFDLPKETFDTLWHAQEAAEVAVERWFANAIYRAPRYKDDDFNFG